MAVTIVTELPPSAFGDPVNFSVLYYPPSIPR
jgi:hypothetical protein